MLWPLAWFSIKITWKRIILFVIFRFFGLTTQRFIWCTFIWKLHFINLCSQFYFLSFACFFCVCSFFFIFILLLFCTVFSLLRSINIFMFLILCYDLIFLFVSNDSLLWLCLLVKRERCLTTFTLNSTRTWSPIENLITYSFMFCSLFVPFNKVLSIE